MVERQIAHYRILDKLGEGGMGVVYRAVDVRLDRHVALKFVSGPADTVTHQRFLQEARATSALNHPHVATMFGFEEVEGQRFIVMELLEGGTLRARTQGRVLPMSEVMDCAAQIADGLAHAHRLGFVHRDLKTDNIMATADGRLKITDFGLAKLRGVSSITHSGSRVGTTSYMSPEQARGDAVDQRSDIFSYGVILYELLTGQNPFLSDHEAAVVYRILHEPPRPVRELRSDIPIALERIVQRSLEKDPAQRYQSVEEIQRELGVSVSAVSATSPRRKRTRWLAAMGLVVAAIVVAGVLVKGDLFPDKITSVAVLPLTNVTADSTVNYMCEGISQGIIDRLSRLRSVRVAARESSFRYRDSTVSAGAAGQQLGVFAVVSGSAQVRGDLMTIDVELTEVEKGIVVWKHTYTEPLRDALLVEDAIADEIGRALNAQPARTDAGVVVNAEVQRSYLEGLYHLHRYSERSSLKAIEAFTRATDLDPNFAPAYVGLSRAYWGMSSQTLPAADAMPRARAAAIKALELDESLSEAHSALGAVEFSFDWNWKSAEDHFLKAVSLNPSNALAYHMYGIELIYLGRPDEARKTLHEAKKLDPLSSSIAVTAMAPLLFAPEAKRDFDTMIEEGTILINLDPSFAPPHLLLARAYAQRGDLERLQFHADRAQALGDPWSATSILGYGYARHGRTQEARDVLAKLERVSNEQFVSPYGFATVFAGLDDAETALDWLEKAFATRDEQFLTFTVDPVFDRLRTHPRYVVLATKMGLAQ